MNKARGKHNTIPPPTIRRFELTEALVENGSATAKAVVTGAGGLETTTKTFEVFDALGIFSGNSGARGYCVRFKDSRRFEVIQMVCS